MQILLLSATPFELEPLLAYLTKQWNMENSCLFSKNNCSMELLYTGVGSVATTYSLLKKLQNTQYDLAIQAGVAGSFIHSISLGSVWAVSADCFADLGAEDHDAFLSVFDLGLCNAEESPYSDKRIVNPHLSSLAITLPSTNAITVQSVSGSEKTIALRRKWDAALESMEGAAFHYVCQKEQLPYLQIRAVSNYVIPRDRSTWKMKEAIAALNQEVIAYIENLMP